jgi:hypothetical protein
MGKFREIATSLPLLAMTVCVRLWLTVCVRLWLTVYIRRWLRVCIRPLVGGQLAMTAERGTPDAAGREPSLIG